MHRNVDAAQLIQSLDETFAYVLKSRAIPSQILGLYGQIWPPRRGDWKETASNELFLMGFYQLDKTH